MAVNVVPMPTNLLVTPPVVVLPWQHAYTVKWTASAAPGRSWTLRESNQGCASGPDPREWTGLAVTEQTFGAYLPDDCDRITYRYEVRACEGAYCSNGTDWEEVEVTSGDPTRMTATAVTYYHTDALGSPVAQTDASGAVIKHTAYRPWGAPADGSYEQGPGYTGHVTDARTGLSYMQQRYYDPIAGRFLSVDPVAASPESFNRYWYANNNPYRFTDPDGRFVQALWGAPVGAIIDIAAQKISNPDQSINWKSVGVSAAVGAVSGGVASVARVAAIRGTVTVGQAIAATAATNAAVGAAGSAADSAVNGEPISAGKMAVAAATNGSLSLAAGLAGAKGVLAEKMASGSPTSPQGIGDHILRTTQSAGGSSASTSAVQGAASAGGRIVDIAKETAVSAAQKKVEERTK